MPPSGLRCCCSSLFWIFLVFIYSRYSPEASPGIAGTAVSCYLRGEAVSWFPCGYFSLNTFSEVGETWRETHCQVQVTHTCNHPPASQAQKEHPLLRSWQENYGQFCFLKHRRGTPPKVGSRRVLRSLPPSLEWFLPTQAQSTWLCSLLISNLS